MKTWTVCEELVRQGYMEKWELILELAYARRTVPKWGRIVYCIGIFPILMLTRYVRFLTPLVNLIARCIWIENAIYQELEYRHNLKLEKKGR